MSLSASGQWFWWLLLSLLLADAIVVTFHRVEPPSETEVPTRWQARDAESEAVILSF